MKLIVSNDYIYKFAMEYMHTFDGYIPTTLERLPEYDLTQCEEIIAVQKGTWLPETILQSIPIAIANMEQLCDSVVEERVVQELAYMEIRCGYKPVVYDYSTTNCTILQKRGWSTNYHPYITPSTEIQSLQMFSSQKKKYDIAFIGALNDRRQKILDELTKSGITVHIIDAFGWNRDIEVAKCNYLLNIHWESHFTIFESIRCNRWLESGYHVLSEESIDTIDHSNLQLIPYKDMVNTINQLISEKRPK